VLTADLARPRFERRGERLHIDMIPPEAPHWRTVADELIAAFWGYAGLSRDRWEAALEAYIGDSLEYVAIRGLAKVLCDSAEFARPESDLPPEEVRAAAFAHGPVLAEPTLFQPGTRAEAIAETGHELGMTPEAVEGALFADLRGAEILTDPGPEWEPDGLLARYNLELARAALYYAARMDVEIYDGYKDFWRYLKLFKLMFWATPLEGGGYHVALDGPISPFVRSTRRYGRQFAAFLPALLLGERWKMEAKVKLPGFDAPLEYSLDSASRLPSIFRASGAFDSKIEAEFAAEFHEKFGDERGKWALSREDEVILVEDTVMVPDFALTHKEDGRRALIEIVGFWHPEYLRRKVHKVRAAGRSDLILLVYEGVNLAKERLADVLSEVLYFANKPVLKDVMAAVERAAKHPK
jgi:hypothetical protein